MATINYAAREINVKIVYYGPALSGKTTNLQVIHKKVPQDAKGDMVSLATESDRTLYFDFLPIDLGKIKGFTTKIQLYTVPGQVYYNATRKLVLRGVDGIVFVADSARDKTGENVESLDNMEENLAEYGYSLAAIPLVLQFNKRDCDDPMSADELNQSLNRRNSKWTNAIARTGEGVFDTLKVISKEVIDILNRKYEGTANTLGAAKPSPTVVMPATQSKPQQNAEEAWLKETPAAKPAPAPQKAEPIFEEKKTQAPEQDFIDIDLNFEEPSAPPAAAPATVKMPAVQDGGDSFDAGIELEDAFEEPSVAAASLPKAVSSAPKTVSPAPPPPAAVKEEIALAHDGFDADDLPSQPSVAANAKSAPLLADDGFDDVHEADFQTSPSQKRPDAIDPIRAALERNQNEKTAASGNMLFSSVSMSSAKTERLLAQKKKPINPKFQKSFMDNLFKKPSGGE